MASITEDADMDRLTLSWKAPDRPDPILVAQVMAANRPRLMAAVATVQHGIAETGIMQRADEAKPSRKDAA